MPTKRGREFDFVWEDGEDDRVEWIFERETAPGPLPASKLDVAKSIYATRRLRDRQAGPHADLFAEPAWDLLLDLYVAHGESRSVTVSRARVTAWAEGPSVRCCLQKLQERGLMSRDDNGRDSGRSQLSLTHDGIWLVERLLPDKLG